MADYKVFKKGNYLIVIDVATDKYMEDSSGDVLVTKSLDTSEVYNIRLKSHPSILNVALANIKDEAGVTYASAAIWETFYTDNTGFNPATSASVTAVADDLATHEADVANPHSVTKAQVGLTSVDDTSDADKPISTATQTALDLKEDALLAATQTVWVAKYGNDANSGLTINLPKLTIAAAITAASALTPTVANPIQIFVIDSGVYSESLLILPANVFIVGKGCEITNAGAHNVIQAAENTVVEVYKITQDGTGAAGYVGTNSVGERHLVCHEIDAQGGSTGLINFAIATTGAIHATVNTILVGTGKGVSDNSLAGQNHLVIGSINISGNGGQGVFMGSTGNMSGNVIHIQDTGSPTGTKGIHLDNGICELNVQHIDCVEAYDIAAGATLNMFVNTLTGTETNAGTANVTLAGQITDATQTALDLKSAIASPTFTGVPLAPTAAPATNTTQIATTAFVLANGSSKFNRSFHEYNLNAEAGTFNGVVCAAASTTTILYNRHSFRAFDNIAEEAVIMEVALPTTYTAGSDIKVTLYTTDDTASKGVRWSVGLTQETAGGLFGQDVDTEYLGVTVATSLGWEVHKNSITFNGTNLSPLETFSIIVYRDTLHVDDDLNSDAYLNQVLIEEV